MEGHAPHPLDGRVKSISSAVGSPMMYRLAVSCAHGKPRSLVSCFGVVIALHAGHVEQSDRQARRAPQRTGRTARPPAGHGPTTASESSYRDRQRPWSSAVRATQLGGYLAPPEVTMPSQFGLVHPVAPVRDLARDLGVSCTQILRIASALGLRVSCPSSVVTVRQAEQIESAYLRTDSLSRVPAPR
jgi:hypothetical protein